MQSSKHLPPNLNLQFNGKNRLVKLGQPNLLSLYQTGWTPCTLLIIIPFLLLQTVCFRTSIWDETLYKAWSAIVTQLIPNVEAVEDQLGNLRTIMGANEVWDNASQGVNLIDIFLGQEANSIAQLKSQLTSLLSFLVLKSEFFSTVNLNREVN